MFTEPWASSFSARCLCTKKNPPKTQPKKKKNQHNYFPWAKASQCLLSSTDGEFSTGTWIEEAKGMEDGSGENLDCLRDLFRYLFFWLKVNKCSYLSYPEWGKLTNFYFGCFGEILLPCFTCVYCKPHLSWSTKAFCRVHGHRHSSALLPMSASRWDDLCPSTTCFPSLTVVEAHMSIIHVPVRRLSAFIWIAYFFGPVKVVLLVGVYLC